MASNRTMSTHLLLALVLVAAVALCCAVGSIVVDEVPATMLRVNASKAVITGRHVIRNSTIPSMKDTIVAAFDWPGVQVKASLTGLRAGAFIAVRMHWHHILPAPSHHFPLPPWILHKNYPSQFRVVLTKASDPSTVVSTMNFTTANQGLNNTEVFSYEVVSGVQFDPTETYNIELTKLTEADWAMGFFTPNFVEFFSFDIRGPTYRITANNGDDQPHSGPALAAASKAATNRPRIEFYGDSITCGYSNRCKSFPNETGMEICADYRLEDVTLSWGQLTCDSLHAVECNIQCYAGFGVTHNCCGGSLPLPALANRSIATDATTAWATPPFQAPEVVVSALGVNDGLSNTTSKAALQAFITQYAAFIRSFTPRYGTKVTYLLVCPPWGGDAYLCDHLLLVQQALQSGSDGLPVHVLDLGHLYNASQVCCSHPDVTLHGLMAAAVVEKLMTIMKW